MYSQLSKVSPSKSPDRQQFLPSYLTELFIVLLLVLATIFINFRMIRDGLNGMTDMRWHIMWLQHFSKQLAEGIWYPRWLAGTNYGYGSPTFVFYPPLVYYLGSLLKFSGLNIENTLITLYSLSVFLAGFNFYIFGRHRWGIIASFIGALAYMTAPYLAYNLYWVSSLSVAYAIAWIPLGWYLTDRALAKPKWKVSIAIFWALLALTHLPNLLLCGIVWLFYTLFFLFSYSWKNVITTILFAGLGLGLASLFLIPAILEQPLVNIASMQNVIGDITNGIFGAGLPFIPKKLDFQVSHIFAHQTLVILVLIAIAIFYCRQDNPTASESKRWILFTLAIAIMMSWLSVPIWEASTTLQKVQAPWRLFSLYAFGSSALCGVVVSKIIKLKLPGKIFGSLIIVAILLFNTSYGYQLARKFPTFRNSGQANLEHLEPAKLAIEEPFTDKLIDVGEYRPLVKPGIPSAEPILGQPKLAVVEGQAKIELESWKSYERKFQVVDEETSTIRVRTYYYPAWHLYVNERPYSIDILDDGTISFTVKPGNYSVKLVYQKTFAFTVGILVSLLSSLILLIYWLTITKKTKIEHIPNQE
ncbi:MAG: 6-pyruvoyl-tetrahydropterin synthase-related protein [Xenococcaceae cyanobacterium]